VKATTLMSDRQCRGAEKQLQFAAAAGGIKDGDKVLLSPEKCQDAAQIFFMEWSWHKGGIFNEIITTAEFTREEIQAIMSRL